MKIKDRGYWISTLYKYQSLFYWLCYSVYFRSITFFSAANPAIHLGGMLDDKKSDIYDMVDDQYMARTIKYEPGADSVKEQLARGEIAFPVVIKPDVGFKGFMVKKIDDLVELEDLLGRHSDKKFLVQEFIDNHCEYSIMCYYKKSVSRYQVSSLVEKHLPAITGNGYDSVAVLIENLNNAFLKKEWIQIKLKNRLDDILPLGQKLVIDHVGNYARGAKFEALQHEIDDALVKSVNEFFRSVRGIYFGRIDAKADSLAELKAGRFKLLEINGAKAEPIHIYDPTVSWWQCMRDIHFHWKTLFQIVKENSTIARTNSTLTGVKSLLRIKKAVS